VLEAMTEVTTHNRILEATEALLRRHGPAKLAVIDVARALGMSHGNVYRHFASKAALLDAIAERWLATVSDPLEVIATSKQSATERLHDWIMALMREKRRKVAEDPEVFAMYHAVAEAAREVVADHVQTLSAQLERIITDGAATGEFKVKDPQAAARAVWNATMRFHHPSLVGSRNEPPDETEAESVIALLLAGLEAGVL
jgi:AcrR family transcriptional regulator